MSEMLKNDNVIKAINDSIAHWERMISWAEKEAAENEIDPEKMKIEIQENWYGEYCPLCRLFYYDLSCIGCPIHDFDYRCGTHPQSMWMKIHKSYDWGDWIKNAKEFLKLLKNLVIYKGLDDAL